MVYELLQELPSDLRLDFRKLGNIIKIKIWGETYSGAQSPFKKFNCGVSSQKVCKSRYQSFLVLSNLNGFLYFVPNILPRIVDFTDYLIYDGQHFFLKSTIQFNKTIQHRENVRNVDSK